ncbi:MAG: signal recognition particle-docking protein FtsY [Deltaproteobacteria bacterium]|nr:signal recognition particle-docking protein FtsY [Deltaproteobacteria bacterium]
MHRKRAARLEAEQEPEEEAVVSRGATTVAKRSAKSVAPVEKPKLAGEEEEEPALKKDGARAFKKPLKPLSDGLLKTRENFIGKLSKAIFGRQVIEPDVLEELEEVLFTADIGVKTAQALLDRVQDKVSTKKLSDPKRLFSEIKQEIENILALPSEDFDISRGNPFVIMMIGVNGTGKTTTIGKLASQLKEAGHNVLMAAGDTFRAAAVEQLAVWGERAGCDVIRGAEGADPGAVVFDAIQAAKARDADIVIADTAGRLHTKVPLMEELKKIKRVAAKGTTGAPHEILLVLDATTGQNAINQAKIFSEALDGITGIVLTKLDGTAKGGVIVGITDELKVPVRFIGIGEGVQDLRRFKPREFVQALFSDFGEQG